MDERSDGFRLVGIGLKLAYAGLCLLVFGVLFPMFGAILKMDPRMIALTAAVMMLTGVILDTVGRLLCLATPDESGSKAIIYVSVCFSVAALIINALTLVGAAMPQLLPPAPIIFLQPVLSIVGAVLFILFLRALALYIDRTDLADKARTVLILGIIIVAVVLTIYLAVLISPRNLADTFSPLVLGIAGLTMIVFGLTLLVKYGNLLTYLGKALLEFANRPPEDEDDDRITRRRHRDD